MLASTNTKLPYSDALRPDLEISERKQLHQRRLTGQNWSKGKLGVRLFLEIQYSVTIRTPLASRPVATITSERELTHETPLMAVHSSTKEKRMSSTIWLGLIRNLSDG